jgi:hypothetical protein
VANRETADRWEKFYLFKISDSTVSFQSFINNRYVCVDSGVDSLNGAPPLSLIANRNTIGNWEKFTQINNSDGTVSFKSVISGRYVIANFKNCSINS